MELFRTLCAHCTMRASKRTRSARSRAPGCANLGHRAASNPHRVEGDLQTSGRARRSHVVGETDHPGYAHPDRSGFELQEEVVRPTAGNVEVELKVVGEDLPRTASVETCPPGKPPVAVGVQEVPLVVGGELDAIVRLCK